MKKKTPAKQTNKKLDQAVRKDGWANVLTGLGVKGMDKRLGADVAWERLPEVDADNYYSADDIARKIVDTLVDESFREGFTLSGVEKPQSDALMKRFNEMNCNQKMAHTWKMARQYGGAGALLITDDMKDMTKPMSEAAFLKGITPLSMWELYAMHEDMDFNILSPTYFTPQLYTYQPRHTATESVAFQKIHTSRIIRFDGAKLSKRFMQQNNFWSDSFLNPLINAIRNYQLSHDAAASVVQDFRIAVFKIKDLAEKIGADDDAAIIKRMEIVNLTRSIARSVLIDADGEDFEYKMGTVTGVKDILDKVENRLVGGTNMPRTILLGESPTGLGGSGRHEQDNWYDYIASQQELYLKPKLMPLFKMFGRELKIDTTNLDIVFNPLWQMDEKEVAELRKMTAETDQIYLQNGVVDADEVAASRFGGDKYNTETEIDFELRKQKPITPEDIQSATPPKTDVKKDGGPGSGVVEDNTSEIIMPQSKFISVGTRKGLLENVHSTPMKVKMSDITHVGQAKYVPEKLKKMVDAFDQVKDKPIALLKVGDEYHVVDGHHRYLAAKKLGMKDIQADVYERTKMDGEFKEIDIEKQQLSSDLDTLIAELSDEQEVVDSIEQVGDKWIVKSSSGNSLGEYETEAEAQERLKQVEAFKHMNNDGGPGSGPQGGQGGSKSVSESKKAFKAADKKVESAGNKYDKNPTPENEAALKSAIGARAQAHEEHTKALEAKLNEVKAVQERINALGEKLKPTESISELESKMKEATAKKEAAEKFIAESKARSAALKEQLKALQAKTKKKK